MPIQADEVWELVAEVWESLLQLPAIRADHAFGLQGAHDRLGDHRTATGPGW